MEMKHKKHIRSAQNANKIKVATLYIVALIETANAQQVIPAPPPMLSLTPPAIADLGPSETQVFPAKVANFLEEVNPLQWGPITLHPHISYQFTDSLGVRSSTNAPPSDTIVQSLSPGVLFVLTRHWTLDYTPTFTFYSNNHFQDNVSHAVSLTGGIVYDDWTLGLSQSFTYSSTPQVQTGAQTQDTSVSTGITAGHQLTSKLALSLGLSQSLNFPSGYQTSKTWSTSDSLNYQFWPRLTAGITVGFGYTEATPNSYFGQLGGTTSWRASDKFSISANAGAQVTQFTSGGQAPLGNPVFGLTIQDQLFKHTQLSLNANEGLTTSYYANQLTENTSVGGSLSQELFKHYTLGVNGSYNWTTYHAAATDATVNSASEYYSIGVTLGTTIFKHIAVSTFYTYSANVTSQSELAFSSNQVGFSLSCAF
jgi:hypothetical protein